jgi:hypothetical protein
MDVGLAGWRCSVIEAAAVASAEGLEQHAAGGGLALDLADDPRIDPARILDRDRRAVRPVAEDDARAIAVVGHPIRLELEDGVGHDRRGEGPVEVTRVQAGHDIVDPERNAALHPGEEVEDPHGRERVAGLGDGRRLEGRVRQTGGRGSEEEQPRGRGRRLGHDLRICSRWRIPTSFIRIVGEDSTRSSRDCGTSRG